MSRRPTRTAVLLLAALASACGRAEDTPRALTIEEVLADCPEELRLPTFLGVAFSAMRDRQLDARPLEDFDLEGESYEPDPLVTDAELAEVHGLLDAAASRSGWGRYATLEGTVLAGEDLRENRRIRLHELADLLRVAGVADAGRWDTLADAGYRMLKAGGWLDWSGVVLMMGSSYGTPFESRLRGRPCLTNRDFQEMLLRGDSVSGSHDQGGYRERLDAVAGCVSCMVAEEAARMLEQDGEELNRKVFDVMFWSLQDVTCFTVCDACDVLPEPLEAAGGEVIGYLEVRRVWEQPGWSPPGAVMHVLPEWETLALDPQRTFVPLKSLRVVEDRRGRPALMFEVTAKDAFGDYTADLVGERVAFLVLGRVVASPYIESALPGAGILSGGSDGFTPWQTTQLMRAIARTDFVPDDAVLLGADAPR